LPICLAIWRLACGVLPRFQYNPIFRFSQPVAVQQLATISGRGFRRGNIWFSDGEMRKNADFCVVLRGFAWFCVAISIVMRIALEKKKEAYY